MAPSDDNGGVASGDHLESVSGPLEGSVDRYGVAAIVMSNGATPRARRLWLGAAVIVLVLVPLAVFGFRTGECVDSVSAVDSYCTSGPAVGVGGGVLLCLAGGFFVVHALRRALGGRSRTSP